MSRPRSSRKVLERVGGNAISGRGRLLKQHCRYHLVRFRRKMKMKAGFGISSFCAVVIIVASLSGSGILGDPTPSISVLWAAGAAALGFLSGFTTGLSKAEGISTEFVKFIGAGILVPLVGGVAALLNKSETVIESSTYSGTLISTKHTTTVAWFPEPLLHPMAVLGSFFVAFGIFACLGVVSGTLIRLAKPGMAIPFRP